MATSSEVTKWTSHQGPVPISWVNALFEKMGAMYGNKFADMWANQDLEKVKLLWAEEMGKLSRSQMKAGVSALIWREWPPTLPEYLKLCRDSASDSEAHKMIEFKPEEYKPGDREKAGKTLNEIGASKILDPRSDSRAWIYKITKRHEAKDATLPFIAHKFALEALNNIGKGD